MSATQIEDLFPGVRNPDGTQMINARCIIRTQDEHRVVLVSGIVLAQYALGDAMAEAFEMCQRARLGVASGDLKREGWPRWDGREAIPRDSGAWRWTEANGSVA